MANPRRAATIRTSLASMRQDPGPLVEKYQVPLDYPELFKWVLGSPLLDDGLTVLVANDGSGAWIRVRKSDQGAALTDADATLAVGGGLWRTLPAATLTANRTLTLSPINASTGDVFEITRIDVTANTLAIANGGIGAGTILTMPVSTKASARLCFDGTNWLHRSSSTLL